MAQRVQKYSGWSMPLTMEATAQPIDSARIRTVILPPPVVEALRTYKQTVSSRWIFPSPKKEDAPLAPAAAKIDQGIGKVGPPTENLQTTATRTMTDFKPQRGKNRYRGSGYLEQTKGGRWNGRYTVTWPDGTKRTRDIYASTKDECEKLLAVMITEMNMEVAAEKERLKVESRAS